jgi:hypothetical protein
MGYMDLAGIAGIAIEHEVWLARTANACERRRGGGKGYGGGDDGEYLRPVQRSLAKSGRR